MKRFVKPILVLVCCYQITACTSLFVSTAPEKMYEGQDKQPEEISIIAGQNYRIKSTYWNQILIENVDNKNVYSEIFDLKFPHVVTVLPGRHDVQLKITIGNQYNYKTTIITPVFIMEVMPGRAYQICHNYKEDAKSKTMRFYELKHITSTDSSSPLPPYIQHKINEAMTNMQSIPNKLFIYIEDVGTVKEYLDYLETEDAKTGKPYNC